MKKISLISSNVINSSVIKNPRLASFSFFCERRKSTASAISELDFNDHRSAFKHKTFWELFRGLLVLRTCSSNILVDNSLYLMRVGQQVLGDRLLGFILNPTIYAQFVAGTDEMSLASVARQIRLQGLRLMVAPALEEDVDEAVTTQDKYDTNLARLLKLAEMTFHQGGTLPCLQCKMSALLSAQVLQNVSNTFAKPNKEIVEYLASEIERRIESADNNECVPSRTITLPGISEQDLKQIAFALDRLAKLGESIRKKSVRLMVDAEQSYINSGCSLLALAMMAAFNKTNVVVANTYQCYFKNALDNLSLEIDICDKLAICFAAKFVRGAYLEREWCTNGSNVCRTYQETGNNYTSVLEYALDHSAANGRSLIIVATHNEDAITFATQRLQMLGTDRLNGNVAFAQIYGMAEQISMPLAQANYVVYKSVPMGPLSQVLPYLSRRAAENRSVLKGARKERQLLEMELIWRIKTQFKYL